MGETRTDAEPASTNTSQEQDRAPRHTVKGMVPLQRMPATVDTVDVVASSEQLPKK